MIIIFRLFCGDLGNEVTDDVLTRVFNKYTSFQKAKVVREKNSKKTKGYNPKRFFLSGTPHIIRNGCGWMEYVTYFK